MEILTESDLNSIRVRGNIIEVYGNKDHFDSIYNGIYFQFQSRNYTLVDMKNKEPPADGLTAKQRFDQLKSLIVG